MTVYSKEKGFTYAPTGDILRRTHRAPRVSVPPNYRGHAIVDGEERPLGGMTDIAPPSPADVRPADTPVPRFDGLPRVNPLGERSRPSLGGYLSEPPTQGDDPATEIHPSPQIPTNFHPHPLDSTNFHSHPLDSTEAHPTPHAPFSPHGLLSLGLEDLLILGLILFLLREGNECADRGDLDETVILLGLLLLLG